MRMLSNCIIYLRKHDKIHKTTLLLTVYVNLRYAFQYNGKKIKNNLILIYYIKKTKKNEYN